MVDCRKPGGEGSDPHYCPRGLTPFASDPRCAAQATPSPWEGEGGLGACVECEFGQACDQRPCRTEPVVSRPSLPTSADCGVSSEAARRAQATAKHSSAPSLALFHRSPFSCSVLSRSMCPSRKQEISDRLSSRCVMHNAPLVYSLVASCLTRLS